MLVYFNCTNEVQVVERDILKSRSEAAAPHRSLARDRCWQRRARTASLLIKRVTHTRPEVSLSISNDSCRGSRSSLRGAAQKPVAQGGTRGVTPLLLGR